MILQTFKNGGFVVHRITGNFRGRASAWFAADGSLLDAEQYPQGACGSARPVKRNGPMWRAFEVIGNRHKHTPTTNP